MLAAIFLYISRENRDRVLQAMGYAWLFLFVALASLTTFLEIDIPFGNFPYQYLKLLYFVTLVVAADRMSHDSPLGRPLGLAGLIAAAVSFAIVFFAHAGSLSYAIHMLIGAVAWLLVTGPRSAQPPPGPGPAALRAPGVADGAPSHRVRDPVRGLGRASRPDGAVSRPTPASTTSSWRCSSASG